MAADHWTQRICLIACTLLFCSPMVGADQQPQLNLMPIPASVQGRSGSLRINSAFPAELAGHPEPRLDRPVQRFTRQLSPQTAVPPSAQRGASTTPALLV